MNRAIPSPLLPAVPRKEHSPKYDADLHLTLRSYFSQLNSQLNSQVQGFGAPLAAATTVNLTNANHVITGSGTIKTINAPAGFSGPVFLVAKNAFSLATGGNIAAAAGPTTPGQMVPLTYNPNTSQWSPIGAGTSGGGAPTGATYITEANETGSLPNSFQLAAGANVTLTPSGSTLTISSSAGGGGVTSLIAGKDIAVNAPTGAVTVSNIMFHPFLLMGA